METLLKSILCLLDNDQIPVNIKKYETTNINNTDLLEEANNCPDIPSTEHPNSKRFRPINHSDDGDIDNYSWNPITERKKRIAYKKTRSRT